MQKTPTYIGIFSVDPKSAEKKLRQFSNACLESLAGQVNSLHVQQDLANFHTKFSAPKDNPHITLLFIGGNEKALKQKQQQQLKTFKSDKKHSIQIQLFVYVPDSIMVGYCPKIQPQCDNNYPHVTLFLAGNTKAVQSNNVLQQVFKEQPNLLKEEFTVKQAKAKYQGKMVFVVKKQVIIDGITGDNFRYGNKK